MKRRSHNPSLSAPLPHATILESPTKRRKRNKKKSASHAPEVGKRPRDAAEELEPPVPKKKKVQAELPIPYYQANAAKIATANSPKEYYSYVFYPTNLETMEKNTKGTQEIGGCLTARTACSLRYLFQELSPIPGWGPDFSLIFQLVKEKMAKSSCEKIIKGKYNNQNLDIYPDELWRKQWFVEYVDFLKTHPPPKPGQKSVNKLQKIQIGDLQKILKLGGWQANCFQTATVLYEEFHFKARYIKCLVRLQKDYVSEDLLFWDLITEIRDRKAKGLSNFGFDYAPMVVDLVKCFERGWKAWYFN
ncbi:hypothetical protein CVT24_012406 [Panaeolus cyanescens]|uniref:Uncharacterized protein n=1 Tax=Panaeolus cyanescens TaxID=181874 RepID=A0A409WK58_9AGAR|nr:hypothetical protein CVT24_012406 [Panaeolus cyanescens]